MTQKRLLYDRVAMALDDLSRCQRYCEMMLTLPIGEAFANERTLYEALFVASVISYGRVFATSRTVDRSLNKAVSDEYGQLRAEVLSHQTPLHQALHRRIIEKRDTAVAHSDATSRDYHHHTDSPLAVGRAPYYPYEHEEVGWMLDLVKMLHSGLVVKQLEIQKEAFSKDIFGIPIGKA